MSSASPRGRGWTADLAVRQVQDGGFPAWAGMDRGSVIRSVARLWLPRVGGDGPGRQKTRAHAEGASPRGRGWTVDRAMIPGLDDGFPAWAGMDPRPRR